MLPLALHCRSVPLSGFTCYELGNHVAHTSGRDRAVRASAIRRLRALARNAGSLQEPGLRTRRVCNCQNGATRIGSSWQPGAGGSHDRDLPCPAGRTRNCANLLICGRQVRHRKLRNGCTACDRQYAARPCSCARTACCHALFPNISMSIRQSGHGRDQGAWQSHHRRPLTTASRLSRVQPRISLTRELTRLGKASITINRIA